MRRFAGAVALLISVSFGARSQQFTKASSAPRAVPAESRLPIQRVVLYKNGVGYFEHAARVRGTQDLNIDFTTAQLNDVLNSLTLVDLSGGRIAGVRFNSLAPLDEQLKALRLPLDAQSSHTQILAALRGTRVEVRSGGALTPGRLFSVETHRVLNTRGDQLADVTEVSLVTDSGEIRAFDLGPGTSVRIADRDLNEDVGRYLDLIGSAKAQDVRRMSITATGEGERDVFVSYISEVPVWKSTYRIILPDKPDEKPLIQGWAVVDNTIGEDWKDVRLSLVAGAPQSFIQQISQPYYVHRPVIALPESATLTPQTHEGALMAVAPPPPPPPSGSGTGTAMGVGGGVYNVGVPSVGPANLQGTVKDPSGAAIPNAQVVLSNTDSGEEQRVRTDSSGHYELDNVAPGASTLAFESPGFQTLRFSLHLRPGRVIQQDATLSVGAVSQTVEVTADSVSNAMEQQQPEAQGQDIGDLFEYDIQQKVTIDKNQSALVPILQARIDVEKVTLWNEDSEHALRALWITNSSGETLDAGSLNILEGNAFAGQGLLSAVHAGERRLISYAADPAVRVMVEGGTSERPITKIVINKGVMKTTREERESKTYTVSNSDASPREVVIEHPVRPDWKLADDVKPEESSISFHRFKVAVAPKSSARLVVEEYQPQTAEYALTNLNSDEIATLTEEQRVTPAMEQAFRRVIEQKSAITALESQLRSREQEMNTIVSDQTRVRENMKALKGSPEERALVERYTRQLDSQEDRLVSLGRELSDLRSKREQAGEKLDQILNELSLSETF